LGAATTAAATTTYQVVLESHLFILAILLELLVLHQNSHQEDNQKLLFQMYKTEWCLHWNV
jgi:hypothetical protein